MRVSIDVFLLVGHKNLEATDNIGQGNRSIILPFLRGLNVVDINDKVFLFALIVNLGLGSVSTRHTGNVRKMGYLKTEKVAVFDDKANR